MNYTGITKAAAGVCALGAVMFLAGGCSNDQAQQPPTVVQTPPPAPPTNTTVVAPAQAPVPAQTAYNPSTAAPQTNNTNAGAGGPMGNALGDKITREIHTNAQMTGSRITAVSNASGTVRLTGRAQNKQQRALAVKTARDEPGVTHVVDKIEIVPTGGIKEASAPPKVIVKNTTRYFYIHEKTPSTPPPPTDQDDDIANPKHPTGSEGGASPDSSLYNDQSSGSSGVNGSINP